MQSLKSLTRTHNVENCEAIVTHDIWESTVLLSFTLGKPFSGRGGKLPNSAHEISVVASPIMVTRSKGISISKSERDPADL